MAFTEEETEALLEPTLQVDPTKEAPSMEAVGDAPGENERSEHLQAAIDEYGEEITLVAYKHGWRPKGEHKGNPDNFVTPVGFVDRFAQTAAKRADKQAADRTAGILATARKEIESLKGRMDKVDEADRTATKNHYKELKKAALADGDDAEYEKLEKAEAAALKEIDDAAAPLEDPNGGEKFSQAALDFFAKHPEIRTPRTTDEKTDQFWAAQRADELEKKYPNEPEERIFAQISAELAVRKGGGAQTQPRGGRTLSDDNPLPSNGGGIDPDKITVSTMNADQRNAFDGFVEMGVYEDTPEGKQRYVDGLNVAREEEAARYG